MAFATQSDDEEVHKGFSKTRQEDTHEFFRFVTDALQNTALAGLPKSAAPTSQLNQAEQPETCPNGSSRPPSFTASGVARSDPE